MVCTAVSDTYTSYEKAYKSKWAEHFRVSDAAEYNQMFENGVLRRVLRKDVPKGARVARSHKIRHMKTNNGTDIQGKTRWVF